MFVWLWCPFAHPYQSCYDSSIRGDAARFERIKRMNRRHRTAWFLPNHFYVMLHIALNGLQIACITNERNTQTFTFFAIYTNETNKTNEEETNDIFRVNIAGAMRKPPTISHTNFIWISCIYNFGEYKSPPPPPPSRRLQLLSYVLYLSIIARRSPMPNDAFAVCGQSLIHS